MFDHIKQNLFSIQGIAVTILHVIFVLGAIQFADQVMGAWNGDLAEPASSTSTARKK